MLSSSVSSSSKFSYKDFKLEKAIGCGNFGIVYKALYLVKEERSSSSSSSSSSYSEEILKSINLDFSFTDFNDRTEPRTDILLLEIIL